MMDADFNCHACALDIEYCECDENESETFEHACIKCPFCGHEHRVHDDPEQRYFEDGEFEHTCGSCSKEFNVYVYVQYSYTSTRK